MPKRPGKATLERKAFKADVSQSTYDVFSRSTEPSSNQTRPALTASNYFKISLNTLLLLWISVRLKLRKNLYTNLVGKVGFTVKLRYQNVKVYFQVANTSFNTKKWLQIPICG